MNKSVITSVSPQECELIASGKQTMLVRKTLPKIETPFKCYIYMTATKERCRLWEYITAYQNSKGEILNGSQKVIGSFVCDGIYNIEPHDDGYGVNQYTFVGADYDDCKTCLSFEELKKYLGKNIGYAWHISDLKIYDKPKELGEFSYPAEHNFTKRTIKESREMGFICHGVYITRPPKSWVYCEPIEEE